MGRNVHARVDREATGTGGPVRILVTATAHCCHPLSLTAGQLWVDCRPSRPRSSGL